MTDNLTKEKRSWNMSRIRSQNTKPERLVRSYLHKRGLRFRLNGKVSKKIYPNGILPGKPDIVLSKYKTVVFIHGCFWHQHNGCKKSHLPKSNTKYWKEKLEKNIRRDIRIMNQLEDIGFTVLIIWECETNNTENLKDLARKIQHG